MRRLSVALAISAVLVACSSNKPTSAPSVASGVRGAYNLTSDALDRFLNGANQEQIETGKLGPQLADLDAKIKKYRDCKSAFEAASGAGGIGGMAARIALRAKCGSTTDEDMMKDRQALLAGPLNSAAQSSGMSASDYTTLKNKIAAYLNGDRSGFTQPGLDLLASRQSDVSKALGSTATQAGTPASAAMDAPAGMGADAAGAASAQWTAAYTTMYISQMFAMQYSSGATMFETPYKPGEWTKWQVTTTSQPTQTQTLERAFLFTTADGGEWWRLKSVTNYKKNGADATDTLVLEALLKPYGTQMKQIVRMRAKTPGSTDPQEMMVTQGMSMVNTGGMFPMKPTPESVQGATVGTETVSTSAGSFSARHVRFGGPGAGGRGGGSVDWWLTDEVPGGWVKFTGGGPKGLYTMQMSDKGTGAKSELGISP